MIENTPQEVKDLIDNSENKPLILDVREQWEYDICHIENSIHIPMGKIADMNEKLETDGAIIVVCHHGIRSRMVAKYLDGNNFTNIINLSGGIDAWSNEIDSSMTKYV